MNMMNCLIHGIITYKGNTIYLSLLIMRIFYYVFFLQILSMLSINALGIIILSQIY